MPQIRSDGASEVFLVFAAPEFVFIGTSLCSAAVILFLRFLVIIIVQCLDFRG
jgi:hypothetical protein